MKTLRALVAAGGTALGGAGIAVAALNVSGQSPRLLTAGVLAAVVGTGLGALGLRRLAG